MDLIHVCMQQLQENEDQRYFHHQVSNYTSDIESAWSPPPESYIRLDVDGSVRDDAQATCGGVFRNHKGRRMADGFSTQAWICVNNYGRNTSYMVGFLNQHSTWIHKSLDSHRLTTGDTSYFKGSHGDSSFAGRDH